MSTNPFQKAQRAQARARVAIDGPSGSGKTWTGLTFATALAEHVGGRVAVIDTERYSAALYADEFDFDAVDFTPPYSPERYVEYLRQAHEAGYGAVLIDSLSHGWNAEGGVLELVDTAADRSFSGNRFAGWKVGTPAQNALVQAIVGAPLHVVATMRTRQEWVIEEDDKGRKKPKRVGTSVQQREGIEYEFTIVCDMDLEHRLVVSKSRARPLSDRVVTRPGRSFADELVAWLDAGEPLAATGMVEELRALAAVARELPEGDEARMKIGAWWNTQVVGRAGQLAALPESAAIEGLALMRSALPAETVQAVDAQAEVTAAMHAADAEQVAAALRAADEAPTPEQVTAAVGELAAVAGPEQPDTEPAPEPGEPAPGEPDPDEAPFTEPAADDSIEHAVAEASKARKRPAAKRVRTSPPDTDHGPGEQQPLDATG